MPCFIISFTPNENRVYSNTEKEQKKFAIISINLLLKLLMKSHKTAGMNF